MKRILIPLFLLAFSLPALGQSPPCQSCGNFALGASDAEAFFATAPAPRGGMMMPGGMPMQGTGSMPGMGPMMMPGQRGGMAPCGLPCGRMPAAGGMGPQMMGGPQMGMMMKGMMGDGLEEAGMLAMVDLSSLQAELSLTDAQVAQLRAIYRPLQKESVGLAAKLRVAEMELLDLVDAEKPDLTAVGAKVRESESVRSQLRLGRINAWAKAKAILTADQRKMLEGSCSTPCGRPCNPADCGMGMGQGMGGRPMMMPGQGPMMMPR